MKAYSDRIINAAESELLEDLSNLDHVFARLPLELYGELLLDVPDRWPRLRRLLPHMPDPQVQINWTGNHGKGLLSQSTAFVRTVLSYFPGWRAGELGLRVLDFGCGWGRLLRLMAKYVPTAQLEGVDPWEKSIELCRECGIRNPLALSQYLPTALPTQSTQFDLIYAFSVFTHLSPFATEICLKTLRDYLAPSGVLAITIRPLEYWNNVGRPDMADTHEHVGSAYAPHNFPVRDNQGEPIYGDRSMEPEMLECSGLRIFGVEYNGVDPLQLVVLLGRA